MKKIFTLIYLLVAALFFTIAPLSAQTGLISGTVVNESSENISGILTLLTPTATSPAFFTQRNIINGNYNFTAVPDGTYYLVTTETYTSSGSYLNQIYSNIPCIPGNCSYTNATPLIISGGNALTGINFVLTQAGTIRGVISDGTTPLPGNSIVFLFDGSGQIVLTSNTTMNGEYEFTGLLAGTYYIKTTSLAGYQSELYENIACLALDCPVTSGTPISVSAGQTTTINIALTLGATISGTVTDRVSGAPLSANVQIFSPANTLINAADTTSDGTYSIPTGFPTGSFYAIATASGYLVGLYENLTCGESCPASNGKPIKLTVGQPTSVNFALSIDTPANLPDLGAKLSGIPATKKVPRPVLIVSNNGLTGASGFDVTLYRSATNKLTNKSKKFKTQHVAPLSAGTQAKVKFTLKTDRSKPYLIAVIDSASNVTEKSEKNNTVVKKL